MGLIYRQSGKSPVAWDELEVEVAPDYEGDEPLMAQRFSTIVVPVSAGGLLGTPDDSVICGWGDGNWRKRAVQFACDHADDVLGAKGEVFSEYMIAKGGRTETGNTRAYWISVVGLPVTPCVTGVLQYAWLEAGLRDLLRVKVDLRDGIAIANPIRPGKDEGVEWPVVRRIVEKVCGGMDGKIYVYPPFGAE